ncbi:TagA domain-containing protein [Pseudomonas sp. NBRC 111124]|uniref:TagA domain-containing protein n=1 Tax=Pseudomonas sp. NBRC 111124 TaxID=1661039 RepID=UPI000761F324|nr:TagA domain-containing protein [Pseudomonas sp. NBRC 111124]
MRAFSGLLVTLSFMTPTYAQPQIPVTAPDGPTQTLPTKTLRNDLLGPLAGQVDFAQTHVIAATRRIFDPFLVPNKDTLVMLRPQTPMTDVYLVVELDGEQTTFPMNRPDALPGAAFYDEENTFSGKIIKGEYPHFKEQTFSYTIPWNLFTANTKISFRQVGNEANQGSLPKDKLLFMTPESEGLVLMNIKGCLFKEEATCRTTVDQYDSELNPVAARIAAREMLSELPTQRLYLGVGKAYWPRIVAMGRDGKPHVYDKINGMEWADFGDKTLPAKAGMGNYWRAASVLGDKKPGYPVAISGQLLDVPDGMPVLPPGVGASCSGSSCNYPYFPDGFWHETGHGLGLPHDTPGRYEDWSYRAYDNVFLPNTHPNPKAYGLPVDYLGKHYFGHVLGSLAAPPWHPSTASAPLIDEFESLGLGSREGSSWKRYIAPYTHQQTLRVQQRFGSLPEGVEYAGIGDDHRAPPPPQALTSMAPSTERPTLPDTGIETPRIGPAVISATTDESPTEKGVPVHTLVLTFSDPSHNQDGINQIYPAIVSNYGNVYSPLRAPVSGHATSSTFNTSALVTVAGQCLASEQSSLVLKACHEASTNLSLQIMPPLDSDERELAPVVVIRNKAEQCLDFDLAFRTCTPEEPQVRWRARKDLTQSDRLFKLQESHSGRFITPTPTGTLQLQANSDMNELGVFYPGDDRTPHRYSVDIEYADKSVDTHMLYDALIAKDVLKTAAINVNSRRQPRTATLKVDDQTVQTRELEDNLLPEVIRMGAEHGEEIPQASPPQWLYLPKYGTCLASTERGTKLAACDENAIWRLPKKNAYPFVFDAYQPVDMMGKCIDYQQASTTCKYPQKDTLWWTRSDLASSIPQIYLQDPQTGRFITARQGSETIQLEPLGNPDQQRFEKHYLPLFSLTQGSHSLEGRGRTVATTRANRLYGWYLVDIMGNDLPDKMPSFMLMTSDGQCLDDELILRGCAFPRTDSLSWNPRKDLETTEGKIRLQNMKNGRFLQVSDSGEVSLEPLDWSQTQIFSYAPVSSGSASPIQK